MRQILSGLRGDIHKASDDDGWGDAGSKGPTGKPTVDTSTVHVDVQDDDWGDLNNPRAMVSAMSRLMVSGLAAMTKQELKVASQKGLKHLLFQ